MPVFQLVVLLAVAAALARRPAATSTAVVAGIAAVVDLAAGVVGWHQVTTAVAAAGELTLFLAAAFWLASFAEAAGLAGRLALALATAARGNGVALYALACATCAVLTLSVSLDGAVVLMLPLLAALAPGASRLRTTLMLGTIVVANASSLALPQGNPANLAVTGAAGVEAGTFVSHLLVPALTATLVLAASIGFVERRALSAGCVTAPRSPAGFSRGELGAALALAAAAATGATSPWLPVPAWLPIPLVAGGALLVGRACGARLPRPIVPWRLGVEIAALAVVAQGLALGQRLPHAHSLVALAGVALVATVLAAAVNNLPASVVLGGAVGGSSVYAALAGLSVGALATPHGSVATMLTLERSRIVLPRYVRRLAPLALAAALGVVGLVRVGA